MVNMCKEIQNLPEPTGVMSLVGKNTKLKIARDNINLGVLNSQYKHIKFNHDFEEESC